MIDDNKCWYFTMHGDPAIIAFRGYRNIEHLNLDQAYRLIDNVIFRETLKENLDNYNPVIGWVGEIRKKENPEIMERVYIPLKTKNEGIYKDGIIFGKYLEDSGWNIQETSFSENINNLKKYLESVEEKSLMTRMKNILSRGR